MSDYSIACTRLDNYIISTIKLLDDEEEWLPFIKEWPHLFNDEIYETMVFEVDANGKVTGRDMNVCIRYKTRTEAIIGHENVVSEWSVKTII
mgnify:CR=1 FL=1